MSLYLRPQTTDAPHLADPELWVEKDVGRLVALALERPAEFTGYDKPFALATEYHSATELAAILSEVSCILSGKQDEYS